VAQVLECFRDERGGTHVIELAGRRVLDRGPAGEAILVAELSPYEGEAEARGALAEYRRNPRRARRLTREELRCPAS
jgi:hypothetical protein